MSKKFENGILTVDSVHFGTYPLTIQFRMEGGELLYRSINRGGLTEDQVLERIAKHEWSAAISQARPVLELAASISNHDKIRMMN